MVAYTCTSTVRELSLSLAAIVASCCVKWMTGMSGKISPAMSPPKDFAQRKIHTVPLQYRTVDRPLGFVLPALRYGIGAPSSNQRLCRTERVCQPKKELMPRRARLHKRQTNNGIRCDPASAAQSCDSRYFRYGFHQHGPHLADAFVG